jgi:hypothetical protein
MTVPDRQRANEAVLANSKEALEFFRREETEEIPNFIGRNFEDVLVERGKDPAWHKDWSIRVLKRDNAYMVVTRDFDPKRINFYIEDGTIVSQMLG